MHEKRKNIEIENTRTHKYPISPEIHWSAQIFVVYTIRFVKVRTHNINVPVGMRRA